MTGDYDLTFYVAGAGILLSGFMLIIIPLLYRCDATARRNTESLHSSSNRGASDHSNNTVVANSNSAKSPVNCNQNNSNQDSCKLLCAGNKPATSPEAENASLFGARSNSDVGSMRVSECESVV